MAPKRESSFQSIKFVGFVSFSIKKSRDILKPPPRVMTNGIYLNISFKSMYWHFLHFFVLSVSHLQTFAFYSKEASDKVHFGTDVTVEAWYKQKTGVELGVEQ